jgi:ubiquinone/menaquinone biosynthesis C-methylase UbiE
VSRLRVHSATGPPLPGLSAIGAYDAIAASYDAQQAGDEWMRRKLHAHYLAVFRPGQRVLDLGCGTGTDAVVLAEHGINVVAIDGAPGMIGQVQAKAAQAGLQHLVDSRVLSLDELCRLEGPFDAAYSSFAGLSTVDLGHFAQDAQRLIRPGGRMVLHMLNRLSLWEWLGKRRVTPPNAAHRTFTIGGHAIAHRLYFPGEAYRHLAGGFAQRGAYGLGALRPPHTVRRLPRGLVQVLEAIDVRAGELPGLRSAGRFFVLDLERRR